MPERFKKKIVRLLAHSDYTPQKLSKLSKALDVTPEDYPLFKEAFEQLRQAGHVVMGAGNVISLPSLSGQIVGTFRANPRGFGFVTPNQACSGGDLFIPPDETANAMTGDTVAVKVLKKGVRSGQVRYAGKVVEILQRAQNRFVGTLFRQPEGWIVQPDGSAFVEPVSVDDVTAKNAREKDKVLIEILSYPKRKYLARGVILEVLGKAGKYESEIRSVVYQYHLPEEFDDSCLVQAHSAAAAFNPEEADAREDITDKIIVTIDPPDAKDFDDAISLEKAENGNWVLGVHIADVSCFVPEDSALDLEARDRGNSIYLPGRTIPMLPEMLSNGVCSLQPGQKRFVKSVYSTYDGRGNVLSRRFANSVMCSTRRLTYKQVDKALGGRTKGIEPVVVKLLKEMEQLSKIIEGRRRENGMLHLDLPETELEMDKSGRVIDAHPADDSYPHTIIEMFMVEANEAVASLLNGLNVSFMRRIHPDPDSLSMQNLAKLVKNLGFNISRTPERKAIQDLLSAVNGTDCAFAVNLSVLRSLEKAQYSPLDIGHYALASSKYCHFTSPIRRYSDLLVHRLLQRYLDGSIRLIEPDRTLSKEELTEIGKHITFTEQRSEDAERELKTILVLQMLAEHIGDELDCVVSGIAGFGVFAQSKKYGVEGLIQTGDLGPDRWHYNQKSCCLIGMNTGKSIHLGQAIKTKIISVNLGARQLNLTPAVGPISVNSGGVKRSCRKASRKGPRGFSKRKKTRSENQRRRPTKRKR